MKMANNYKQNLLINKNTVQQVGIKYYVYNIVAWKKYNIKFAKLLFYFWYFEGYRYWLIIHKSF